ncbi:MAG: hypothetical protein NVSMB6_15190 [Burkholderiaceae bacterium]
MAFAALLSALIGGLAASYILEKVGVPPRLLAPYIEKRTSGHNPAIVSAGEFVGRILRFNDRGHTLVPQLGQLRIGAQPEPAEQPGATGGVELIVSSTAEALAAIDRANPGDKITFAPGRYRFSAQKYIAVNRPGTVRAPIVVRAVYPGTVILEFAMVEGFLVAAPYWHFENLTIVGSCESHYDCEHAFHVVGKGHHFVARNNTVVDFNSHFKINAIDNIAPDDGLIESNTLTNNSVRDSGNPVNVIDLVVASKWVIRKNLITDFFKGGGNRTSYGGYAKGGGHNNVFENNIVLCEYRLRSPGAISIGLSLGGGGTGTEYCRDKQCVTEQVDSTIRGNLIASCSDDGIYVNKGAMSEISHNTVIDTGGISIRFPSSSAQLEGNLVDGKIRTRDGALLHATDNMDTSITRLALGSHPVRDIFPGFDRLDLRGTVPRRSLSVETNAPDLCTPTAHSATIAKKRTAPAYGAFEKFGMCLR